MNISALNNKCLYAIELTQLLLTQGAILVTESARIIFEYQPSIDRWLAYGPGVGSNFRILTAEQAFNVCKEATDAGIPVQAVTRSLFVQNQQTAQHE